MRTFPDRIRHTVLFEIIAIVTSAVVGAWIVDASLEVMGVMSLMFSALAMVWNMLFNWLFDMWDKYYRHSAKRTVGLRIVHALLFETGMVIAGMFLIVWWLETTFWFALTLDIGFAAFFVVYAFCFNWLYDECFPIPQAVP